MIDDKEILNTLLYITERFNKAKPGEEKEILRAHMFELSALIEIICAINGTSEESLEKKLNGCWKKHYKMCIYGLGEDRKPKHKKGR
jgi:hypothetical protein